MFCFHKNILQGEKKKSLFCLQKPSRWNRAEERRHADRTDSVTKGCVSFKVDVAEYKGPRAGQPGRERRGGEGRGCGPWRLNKTSICHQSGKWKSTRNDLSGGWTHSPLSQEERRSVQPPIFNKQGEKRGCHTWEIDPVLNDDTGCHDKRLVHCKWKMLSLGSEWV